MALVQVVCVAITWPVSYTLHSCGSQRLTSHFLTAFRLNLNSWTGFLRCGTKKLKLKNLHVEVIYRLRMQYIMYNIVQCKPFFVDVLLKCLFFIFFAFSYQIFDIFRRDNNCLSKCYKVWNIISDSEADKWEDCGLLRSYVEAWSLAQT